MRLWYQETNDTDKNQYSRFVRCGNQKKVIDTITTHVHDDEYTKKFPIKLVGEKSIKLNETHLTTRQGACEIQVSK